MERTPLGSVALEAADPWKILQTPFMFSILDC